MVKPKLTEPNKLSLFELECLAYSWGWSKKKFFNSDIDYFFKTWKGKRDAEMRFERQEWERLRMLGVWVLSPYKSLKTKELLPLPWDKTETRDDFYERNKDLIPIWDKLDGR